ncbi:Fe(3+) ions import ATP-binding protein FbpC [Pontiella desulfatans]|uniref:Fe(3+) ions import ATP-binding protein FbpC n=1 Tax=Pontiella desulfatans TaxID=2750659 RepID=A0A6C2U9G3_PONDE|nr:molybdenum ABC transporter ATP-binding protein [Pontiella desulfatans]VGO16024.1 Fe(3+) ions import ATP-binding protein FbpC [Pontiella desulfatans]
MKLDVDIYLKQGRFLLDAQFKCFESALGIFGPSGCGKSTLFRALAGLVRPDGGHIILGGQTLFDASRRVFVPPHRRHIGLVFQDARLFPHWSVEQNLRAGECVKGRTLDRPYSFDDIVELLNIGHLIHRAVDDLSGGEKQRIAIGRTLLSNPRLMLMDEPVSGLDVSLKSQILPFLAQVHQSLKIPTVLISHDLGEILQLTDQLLLMREGSVVGNNTLDQLVRNPATLSELKGADLTNMIRVRVRKHDETKGITLLEVPRNPDYTIEMKRDSGLEPGREISLGIAANQIVLATQRMGSISIRNQLPGSVLKIIHTDDRSICHIETPAGILFAEITPGTEQELGLCEGSATWVLFKGLSIERI